MLLYTLGKEFLTQKIPDRLYDAYVESFCEKLLLLFTADDIPKIEQVNDDG
ncbi:hypothetical protein KA478_03820 [Patescibacteria group bacterium]|nr:hypothetical protein [Patescibacteria group bacterium]